MTQRFNFGIGLVICLLMLAMAIPAPAQLPGGQLLSKTAVVPIMDGDTAKLFTIAGTNADVAPIYLGGVKNIGWEITAQTTNTTATLTLMLNLFDDASQIAGAGGTPTNWPPLSWWQVASNATATSARVMTVVANTTGVTVGTNYAVDGFQWMVPLYLTNSGKMVSNLTVRWFLKPGM